jgi:hypothetical protein
MGCQGDVARGLTNQIAAKLVQMGYSFKTLDSRWIHCSGGCVNMLQSSAADALAQAAASANDYITLNSAWRSSAEQYMLYRWYQKGMCGITLAAKPGQSNHEGGRAVDTSNYNYWLNTLAKHGYAHTYPSSDPVHFDYNFASTSQAMITALIHLQSLMFILRTILRLCLRLRPANTPWERVQHRE